MLEYNIKNKGVGTLGNFLQPLDLKEKIPQTFPFSLMPLTGQTQMEASRQEICISQVLQGSTIKGYRYR